MPWLPDQASKHKRGLTSSQSKKWARIANSVLRKDGDEGKAIRIANVKAVESLAEKLLLAMGEEKWMQKAVHPSRKGQLHAVAAKAGALTKSGTIKKEWLTKRSHSSDKKTRGQALFALRGKEAQD